MRGKRLLWGMVGHSELIVGPRRQVLVSRANSTGRRNTIQSVETTILPLADHGPNTCVTWGLSRSCNQAAQVPSSKVTCKLPRRPWINCRMVAALVSRKGFGSVPGTTTRTAAGTRGFWRVQRQKLRESLSNAFVGRACSPGNRLSGNLLLELPRRHAGKSPKRSGEMALVGKSAGKRNLRKIQFRGSEE